jgi:hypothetical protein
MRLVRLFAILALLPLVAPAAHAGQALVARPPSPVGVVLRDGVVGGLVGSAVAGGIVAYNLGADGRAGADWGRTLAWGAGIGLGAGLIAGLVRAATAKPGAATHGAVRDGLSRSLDARARDQSHSHLFPLLSRSFF